jgi:hypothetical protein
MNADSAEGAASADGAWQYTGPGSVPHCIGSNGTAMSTGKEIFVTGLKSIAQAPDEVSYWPVIRQHLLRQSMTRNGEETEASASLLRAICPICRDELDVRGLDRANKAGIIMACGHIFCDDCMREWSSNTPVGRFCCALCRQALQCICQWPCIVGKAPRNYASKPEAPESGMIRPVEEDFRTTALMVPLTIPEGARLEEMTCSDCEAPRLQSAEKVFHTLLVSKLPDGCEGSGASGESAQHRRTYCGCERVSGEDIRG